MTLTDLKCRSEKPGTTRKKLSDGRGLQLWVQPGGAKLWQLVYQFQGKQRQMALGPFPEVSLAVAREQREAAKRSIREGIDPASTRPGKVPPPTPPVSETGATFREVAALYLVKRRREHLAHTTMTKKEWLLDLAMPALVGIYLITLNTAKLGYLLRRSQSATKAGTFELTLSRTACASMRSQLHISQFES